jgi:hypothetical protein
MELVERMVIFIENLSTQTDFFDKLCDCKCFTEGFIGDHEDDCMTVKARKDYNALFKDR